MKMNMLNLKRTMENLFKIKWLQWFVLFINEVSTVSKVSFSEAFDVSTDFMLSITNARF